jgi:hypothetical protein
MNYGFNGSGCLRGRKRQAKTPNLSQEHAFIDPEPLINDNWGWYIQYLGISSLKLACGDCLVEWFVATQTTVRVSRGYLISSKR